jgi:hypothetical protein
MEHLRLAIPNLEDERVFDQLFSRMQALARATSIRANLAGPAVTKVPDAGRFR